jgi:hypothetical protein
MFIRLTDGRVAYTDNASFFFILTEPYFHTLLDPNSVLPEPAPVSTHTDAAGQPPQRKPGLEN